MGLAWEISWRKILISEPKLWFLFLFFSSLSILIFVRRSGFLCNDLLVLTLPQWCLIAIETYRLNHKIYILTFWCNFLLLFGFGNWCFLLLLAIIEVIVLLLFWCWCTPVLPRDEFRFIRMRKYVDRLIYKIMSVKW